MTLARGEWIAFVDDDCLPSKYWLRAYAEGIVEGKDFYSGMTTCVDGLKSPTPLLAAPYNLDGTRPYSCNLLIRRTLFDRSGGFDEDFPHWNEDVDFVDRLTQAGQPPQFVPSAVVDHPPRRRELGWAAGLGWESRVMLRYKQGDLTPPWRWLPVHLLKIRVKQILECRLSVDSFIAARTLPAELTCVLFHLRAWTIAHRLPSNIAPSVTVSSNYEAARHHSYPDLQS